MKTPPIYRASGNLDEPESLNEQSPDVEQTVRHFRILGLGQIEVRAIPRIQTGTHKIRIKQFDFGKPGEDTRLCDFVSELTNYTEDEKAFQGIYACFNPINESYVGSRYKAVKDSDISKLQYLFIDVDCVRKGVTDTKCCATTDEHESSWKVTEKVVSITEDFHFPAPYIVSTGNGFQLYWKVDLPNNVESVDLIKQVLGAFAALADTEDAHIDLAVSNPSRISRLPGTYNRKSPHTLDRPNRYVRIESVPDSSTLDLVTKDQLKALIAKAPSSTSEDSTVDESIDDLSPAILNTLKDEVIAYLLNEANVSPANTRTKEGVIYLDLPSCPFRGPEHDDGNPAVVIWTDGNISLKCFHSKCEGKGWDAFQAVVGRPFETTVDGCRTNYWCDPTKRTFDDPLRLARAHADKSRTVDGDLSTAFLNGKLYEHTKLYGWVEKHDSEIAPWLRETAQKEFDRHARKLSVIKGKLISPRNVSTQVVANMTKALHSISKHAVSPIAVAPFWLSSYEDWHADDLLVLQNGILNIRKYIECEEHFIPLTVKLFYEHQASFPYDSDVKSCPEWHKFLESLEQDENWSMLLQEIMGYALWPEYDLQKIFMFCGSTRGGKGTIVGALEQLVGGDAAVCGLELKDFAKDFGLEKTLGKKLATFGDIDMPTKEVSQIVAKLKAASGGDLISIDRKNKLNISTKFSPKMIMATNMFMPLPDNSSALQGRTIPLKFTKSFLGMEDASLGQRLAEEYSGILQ